MVPKPYHVHKNIVVMQYLGWSQTLPTVKELPPENPKRFINKLKEYVKAYRMQKLRMEI